MPNAFSNIQQSVRKIEKHIVSSVLNPGKLLFQKCYGQVLEEKNLTNCICAKPHLNSTSLCSRPTKQFFLTWPKSLLPCRPCLSQFTKWTMFSYWTQSFLFSILFRCGIYDSFSEHTLPTLLCKENYEYIMRISSHTHYCIYPNAYTVPVNSYHRSTEWKEKLLCMLKSLGMETSKQPPTSSKMCQSSPLHYIWQSPTKTQFFLYCII